MFISSRKRKTKKKTKMKRLGIGIPTNTYVYVTEQLPGARGVLRKGACIGA